VISNFEEKDFASVFVKSSTGFYTTENNVPNGATIPSIMLMLENATPLPVKADRTYDEAVEMIKLGGSE
jgi:deoxyribose-phosphate aldolase